MIKKVNTYKAVRFRVCFLAAEGETRSTTLRRHLSNKHCINWTKSATDKRPLLYVCFLAAEGETCSTTLRRHLSNKHCINWTKSATDKRPLLYIMYLYYLHVHVFIYTNATRWKLL